MRALQMPEFNLRGLRLVLHLTGERVLTEHDAQQLAG